MGLKREKSESFSHGIKLAQGVRKKAAAKIAKPKIAKPKHFPIASPFCGFPRPRAADVRALHSKLAMLFGERRPGGARRRDILGNVVGTILSQNTTNTNSHMAFTRLKKAFPTWDAVRTAKAKPVEDAIRCGGLAPKKTPWIQHICRTAFKEAGKTS